jgi:hypothetical protein
MNPGSTAVIDDRLRPGCVAELAHETIRINDPPASGKRRRGVR